MKSSPIVTIDESDVIWAVMNHTDELGTEAEEIMSWLANANERERAEVTDGVAQEIRKWVTNHCWREIEDVIVANVSVVCSRDAA